MLYLALSCLQGRPAAQACRDLKSLGVQAIQLTPGNVPEPELATELTGMQVRTHHGFSWHAMKQPVWDDAARCRVTADSVHPPRAQDAGFERWWDAMLEAAAAVTCEVMYPGYRLGDGTEVERAMRCGLRLAIDVSHLHIQLSSGVMTQATWQRLQAYPHITEIHVSANAGRVDSHRPIASDTFGLAWARERCSTGVPLVLECYMHKLSQAERLAQVEFFQ